MIKNFNLKDISKDIEIDEIKTKDVAIIGMDFKIPGASTEEELWEVLKNGKECLDTLSERRQNQVKEYLESVSKSEEYVSAFGGYLDSIDEFDYGYFKITPKEAELMNPAQRMMLESVKNMIENAGYTYEDMKGSNTGVYIGMISDVGVDKYKDIIRMNEDKSLLQIAATGNLTSIMPGRVSYFWDLKGPSILIDTACSSSLVALHMACMAIRNGECRQAIVGGINLDILPMVGDIKVGFESKSGKTRPFSENADGTVLGEGVITLLVKPIEAAVEDKDNIYAIIKGGAVNQDGYSMGITAPNSEAQESVIIKAWENAGINPMNISYIETHGTGTILGDPIEVEGIKGAFFKYGKTFQSCAIGSVKGNIGHLYGAAGLIGIVKCVLALKKQQIPPSINFDKPNVRIDFENSPVYVNDRLNSWGENNKELLCGISSFGFSGTNCHVVLSNYSKRRSEKIEKMIFTISADTLEELHQLIKEYQKLVNSGEKISYKDICFTSCVGRKHYKYRVAAKVSNNDELVQAINSMKYDKQEIQEDAITLSKLVDEEVSKLSRKSNEEVLDSIYRYYLHGAIIPWKKIYKRIDVNRTLIPKLHLQSTKCWLHNNNNLDFSKMEMRGNSDNSYSEVEVEIGKIIMEVLGISEIDINKDIMDYGGDSIILSKVYEKIDNKYKGMITLPQLFVYSSVKKMSEYICRNNMKNNESSVIKIKPLIGQSVKEIQQDEDLDEMFELLEHGEVSLEETLEKFMNS